MQKNNKRSLAQKEADKAYEAKRKAKARLPGGYLTEEEDMLLNQMAEIYGSKKAAIFEGLNLLKKVMPSKS